MIVCIGFDKGSELDSPVYTLKNTVTGYIEEMTPRTIAKYMTDSRAYKGSRIYKNGLSDVYDVYSVRDEDTDLLEVANLDLDFTKDNRPIITYNSDKLGAPYVVEEVLSTIEAAWKFNVAIMNLKLISSKNINDSHQQSVYTFDVVNRYPKYYILNIIKCRDNNTQWPDALLVTPMNNARSPIATVVERSELLNIRSSISSGLDAVYNSSLKVDIEQEPDLTTLEFDNCAVIGIPKGGGMKVCRVGKRTRITGIKASCTGGIRIVDDLNIIYREQAVKWLNNEGPFQRTRHKMHP